MHENFILSERAGETHYLCSETAKWIGGGKENRRKQYGRQEKIDENGIGYLINWWSNAWEGR